MVLACAAAKADIVITGSAGGYFIITNTGAQPLNFARYSYDDGHRTPGAVSLSSLGILESNESAIVAGTPPATFRAQWQLSASIRIADGGSINLDRAEEINIFDGCALAARAVRRIEISSTDLDNRIEPISRQLRNIFFWENPGIPDSRIKAGACREVLHFAWIPVDSLRVVHSL